jgi:uncharacterized protein YegP (UPF0339 family)
MAEKKKAITFLIYRDKTKQYRWRAVHRNGRILADSGESYIRLKRCKTSLDNFQNYILNEDFTNSIL